MSFMYYDHLGNVVHSRYVQSLRIDEANRLTPNQPGAAAAVVVAGADQFVGIDAPDAFDPGRFPIVAAFDAARYHNACVERYCVAAQSNSSAAARYPLLGHRQAPTMLTLNDDDHEENDFFDNHDLVDYSHYYRRSSDGLWVLINEPIVSSTTNDDDDCNILPFERIGDRISSDQSTADLNYDNDSQSNGDEEH